MVSRKICIFVGTVISVRLRCISIRPAPQARACIVQLLTTRIRFLLSQKGNQGQFQGEMGSNRRNSLGRSCSRTPDLARPSTPPPQPIHTFLRSLQIFPLHSFHILALRCCARSLRDTLRNFTLSNFHSLLFDGLRLLIINYCFCFVRHAIVRCKAPQNTLLSSQITAHTII